MEASCSVTDHSARVLRDISVVPPSSDDVCSHRDLAWDSDPSSGKFYYVCNCGLDCPSIKAEIVIETVPIVGTREDPIAPVMGCSCGIYALKAPVEVPTNQQVLGVAQLWGKIVRASEGYRAQCARIVAFVGAPQEIADRYRVHNFPSVDYARREFFGESVGA